VLWLLFINQRLEDSCKIYSARARARAGTGDTIRICGFVERAKRNNFGSATLVADPTFHSEGSGFPKLCRSILTLIHNTVDFNGQFSMINIKKTM
jgi:hypothetical protein